MIVTTGEAARLLNVQDYHLLNLIRRGRLKPEKSSSGQYVWSARDLAAAKRMLGGAEEVRNKLLPAVRV